MVTQQVVINLITIFVVGFIARRLGSSRYGMFTLAFTFVSIFKIFTGMGLRALTVREVASARAGGRRFASRVLGLRLLLALLAVCAALGVVFLLGYPLETRLAIAIALPTLLLEVPATAAKDVFQAFERMEYVAVVDLAVRLTTAVGAVSVLLLGFGLYAVVLAYAAGSLVAAVLGLILCRRRFIPLRPDFSREEWQAQLRAGLPFALTGLLSSLYIHIDVLMLSKLSDSAAVGLYNAATNLVYRLTFLSDALATAAFPALSATYWVDRPRAESILRRLTFFNLLLGIPAALLGTFAAEGIILLIYGAQYASAIIVFRVAVCVVPLMFLTMLLNYALGAIRRQHLVAGISAANLAFNVGLNLVLIPRFNELGAAMATVATEVFALMLFVLAARRGFHRIFDTGRTLRLLLAGVLAAAGGTAALRIHPVLAVVTSGALFAAGVVALRAATPADLRRLLRRELSG
jgi:O-antigen/teichoic acid export membrane protein